MGTEDGEIVRFWHGDQIPGIVEEQNHQRIQTLCKCFEDFTVTGVEPCTLKSADAQTTDSLIFGPRELSGIILRGSACAEFFWTPHGVLRYGPAQINGGGVLLHRFK